MTSQNSKTRVVYLLGAGASHACVASTGSPHGILMRDLGESLSSKLGDLVKDEFASDSSLINLVNSVIAESADIEHIVSFLDDAPSSSHRRFAGEMRNAFEEVLRDKLDRIESEIGDGAMRLYRVLVDMHNLEGFPEDLHGIITTNYDEFMERAIEQVNGIPADFGIRVEPATDERTPIRLLKLHGSFGWQDSWPIHLSPGNESPLWIPPGINKATQAYPFNLLWGLAREMLSCDLLRIIGCRLAANDWDLISLLFAMRHVAGNEDLRIEVIDSPKHVKNLKESYPYLELVSILDDPLIGSDLVADFTASDAQDFGQLSDEQQESIIRSAGDKRNWFELWLRFRLEAITASLPGLQTESGEVADFLST